jgi:hypothetical protein
MTIGAVVKDVQVRETKRGAKSKWAKLFQVAKDNQGKFVCVAEAEDEVAVRKLYNNVRSAAHRTKENFGVFISEDNKIYIKYS